MHFKEKIKYALYAQAVADAVGNPFEFKEKINPDHVIDYANNTKKLVISDDTQMALFGFEAISNLAKYPKSMTLTDSIRQSFSDSYLDWYYTQTNHPLNHKTFSSGLLSFKSMYSVQSPGNTCLDSLFDVKTLTKVRNNSKGCGSIMRLLPVFSLRGSHSLEDCVEYAKITADITHKHKENAVVCVYYMNTCEAIDYGLAFESAYHDVKDISSIGEGWTALECFEMANWAYTKADTFDDLLRLSIAHGGDSDSVAAVAGSMWGLSGLEVPRKYIEKLDALDAIDHIISIL